MEINRDQMVDETFIKRCFQLSNNGLGLTYPNPLVGCVVVKNGQIIGEGWHQKAGHAHAEIDALSNLLPETSAKDATLYVNLEPCSHYGKTPPCADRIIREGIRRVVIANTDPNPEVAGRGIKKLRDAGIEVTTGILESEGEWINRRFFTFHRKKRPFVILKWAESADGFIAGMDGPITISNDNHRRQNHKWRAEEAAILVGGKTALLDNPRLNIRHWTGENPLRIIIDKYGNLPRTHRIFDGKQKTWIITEKGFSHPDVEVLTLSMQDNQWISHLLSTLYENNIQSLIVEGGAATHRMFYETGVVDEIRKWTNVDLKIGGGVEAFVFRERGLGAV